MVCAMIPLFSPRSICPCRSFLPSSDFVSVFLPLQIAGRPRIVFRRDQLRQRDRDGRTVQRRRRSRRQAVRVHSQREHSVPRRVIAILRPSRHHAQHAVTGTRSISFSEVPCPRPPLTATPSSSCGRSPSSC